MTESETTESAPRHGRRARALPPEEITGPVAVTAAPGIRGAVAAPTADAPVPTLRKFGRRARIIELSEAPESVPSAPVEGSAADDSGSGQTAGAESTSATVVIDRDKDGVELGELSVSEAPDPRPAPRFEGQVLHRPERSGGRPLLWLVWILIAAALVALVVLLLTGIIGPAQAQALAGLLPVHPIDPSLVPPLLEEASA